jgi:hypothetical protein
MSKRTRERDQQDPEYQRWKRKYPHFPGVAKCTRLIRAGKARRVWGDMIASELAENAGNCLAELIETFQTDASGEVRLYVMMALEDARLPESVPFLAEVLHSGDPRFVPYAERALRSINTPEARTELWKANHGAPEALGENSSPYAATLTLDVSQLHVGMSREDIFALFGEPDLMGGASRKYRNPSIFRYGRIEFLFESAKSGGLIFVQEVDEFGSHVRTLFPTESAESPCRRPSE